LGFVAVITGEIVPFAVRGLIPIVLNVHRALREVRDRLDGKPGDAEKSEEK
jgi:hypothetical protein